MPSVGMRRTTRVLGARLLRSGRRVWTGSGEEKQTKKANGEEFIDPLETPVVGSGGNDSDGKENGQQENDDVLIKQEVMDMDFEEETDMESEHEKLLFDGSLSDNNVGRTCTNVYTRKRKKVDSNCSDASPGDEKDGTLEGKKRLQTYSRKTWSKSWTKKIRLCEVAEVCDSNVSCGVPDDLENTLKVIVRSSYAIRSSVACLLDSVLRYMRKSPIGMSQLFAFFHSKPVAHVYSSRGIYFLQDSNFILEQGVCLIMGTDCFLPVFALDFSAVPNCFRYLHMSMLLQGCCLSSSLSTHLMGTEGRDGAVIIARTYSDTTPSATSMIASGIDYSGKMEISHVDSVAKLASRNLQHRNGPNIQKSSSVRSKRGRPPSSLSARKHNGAFTSNWFGSRQNGLKLHSMASAREPRGSAQRSNSSSMKQVKSALVELPRDLDSTTCTANILVMESDRCYREQGAVISLEVSPKKQWYLAVKTGGMKRYSLVTEKIMRPCSCNRFTHAIIWAADSGWKLEFPERLDWLIFKELYKECSDRNVQVPLESCIPVPGVHEVTLSGSSNDVFVRPASYITVKDDELARALTRRVANYDMDSDDEEWISIFNNEFSAENGSQMILSDETFELIIDAFERGFHCNPDDYSDETVAPNIGLNVEKQVLESVYNHWIKKRKQKRSALVRVFQCYEPRRIQLIPKSVLRKKRSFKRQGSQAGRGKHRPFLHAIAANRDAEEQRKVEEAKAAARRSLELALLKRQRAQLLMENADLLTYKATMALRIAELAQIARLQDANLAQPAESQDDDAIVPLCSEDKK